MFVHQKVSGLLGYEYTHADLKLEEIRMLLHLKYDNIRLRLLQLNENNKFVEVPEVNIGDKFFMAFSIKDPTYIYNFMKGKSPQKQIALKMMKDKFYKYSKEVSNLFWSIFCDEVGYVSNIQEIKERKYFEDKKSINTEEMIEFFESILNKLLEKNKNLIKLKLLDKDMIYGYLFPEKITDKIKLKYIEDKNINIENYSFLQSSNKKVLYESVFANLENLKVYPFSEPKEYLDILREPKLQISDFVKVFNIIPNDLRSDEQFTLEILKIAKDRNCTYLNSDWIDKKYKHFAWNEFKGINYGNITSIINLLEKLIEDTKNYNNLEIIVPQKEIKKKIKKI